MRAKPRHRTTPPATEGRLLSLAVRSFADLPILLRIEQAAQVADVSVRTIWRWVAREQLTLRRAPGSTRVRVKRDELLALLGIQSPE